MLDDLAVTPGCGALRREAHDEMIMIAHQRVGTQVDGENVGQQGQSFEDAWLAVFVRLAGNDIHATQEGAPYATANAVVVGCVAHGYERGTGASHP